MSETHNPYEPIMTALRRISGMMEAALKHLEQEREPWETLPTAAARRGKSPNTLKRLAESGEIRHRREGRPGGRQAWLLCTADLDRLFPVRA